MAKELDNFDAMDSVEREEQTDHFPCPACGGDMNFDPDSQELLCPYCNNRIEIEKLEGTIHEYDLSTAEEQASDNWGFEKRVIKCENCGAKTVLRENEVAQFCAFCGSAHVVKIDETAGIAPESVIPFKVSRENAGQRFSQWIKSRFFAPNALKREHQSGRLTGVYIPHWTYDADTDSSYVAQAGTYYYVPQTVTVTENGKQKQVTKMVRKTRWRFVSGSYSAYYNDILINASSEMDENLMEKLEPYHLNELELYRSEFLSGFVAERYSLPLTEGWDRAKDYVESWIRSGITKQINADEVRGLHIRTAYNQITYKLVLLPIWISSYTYRGKVYRYMINGQTGEVQGKAPVSALKVLLVIMLAAAVGIGIYWLGSQS